MANAAPNEGVPKAKVFISYSRKDMAFADRLEAALRSRGLEPLIDRAEIYAFEDWWQRIEGLIVKADTIVFALSPDSVTSDVALKEVAFAASLNKRFAPIVCRQVPQSVVPDALARLNFIFFDDSNRFEASADQLAAALKTDITWIRRHTEFGEASWRWEENGRPSGLLLRPPVLDQAEAWIAYSPDGAPSPTIETKTFIATSRKAELASKRRNQILNAIVYGSMLVIIAGLIGWINQDYIKGRWRWYTTERPFVAANIWPYVLSEAAEQTLKPKDNFRECANVQGKDYCPVMVVVPAGSFMMGSLPTEKGRSNTEGPRHVVTISKAFAVSKFPLTFDEWDTCVAYGYCESVSDSSVGRGQQPVFNVSWNDANRYTAWLSEMTGKRYRLLTEAEYEYATRAGTQTAYPWGDDIGNNNANCDSCGSQWDNRQSALVGSFAPNSFNLYDMVGNVMQWVEDCYFPSYEVQTPQGTLKAPTDGSAWIGGNCSGRVVRGGSWRQSPEYIRSANRDRRAFDARGGQFGLRVARTLAITP